MKVCLLSACIGNDVFIKKISEISNEKFKNYCKKYGFDFFKIENQEGHILPYFVKFEVKKYLENYDYVIWCDNDILISDDAPNILDQIDLSDNIDIWAFDHSNVQLFPDKKVTSRVVNRVKKYSNKFDLENVFIKLYNGYPYYNTGLMVLSKGFLEFFKDPIIPELNIPCWDQEAINYAIASYRIKAKALPLGFGNNPDDYEFTKKYVGEKYFLHFIGGSTKQKYENITKYLDKKTKKIYCMRSEEKMISGLRELCEYLKRRGVKTIAEIGSYAGESTKIFSEYFDFVFAIDIWENGYDKNNLVSETSDMKKVEDIFDSRNLRNVVKMKMTGVEASRFFSTIDFVYFDGNHTYEGFKRDYDAWKNKAKYIGGHDYNSNYPGVINAVNEFFPNIVTFKDSSWISGRYSISAVLIVKNEEIMIQTCLKTVKDFDEIVVVDTGSEDSTIEKIKELNFSNLKLIIDKYKWKDDFADARNFAKSFATTDYILSIDADQKLLTSYFDIRDRIDGEDSYYIWNKYSDVAKHREIRLFKNIKEIKWKDRIHVFVAAKRAKDIDIVMFSGYSPAHKKDPDRSLRILEKFVEEKPEYARARYYYAREFWYRKNYERAIQEFECYLKYSNFSAEKADAYLYIARCYWLTNRGNLARKFCLKAIEINPDFKEALLFMSEITYDPLKSIWKRYSEYAKNQGVLFSRV